MPGPEPTHGDILEKLGELKGQVATLILIVSQKREDINALYARIGLIEKTGASHTDVDGVSCRVALLERQASKWLGICLAITFLFPLAVPGIQRMIGHRDADPVPQPTIPHRTQP
jgi:hypothetical protein